MNLYHEGRLDKTGGLSFTLNVYGRANMQQKIKCMNLLNELL